MNKVILAVMVVIMAIMSTGCANKVILAPIEKVTYENEKVSTDLSVFNIKLDVANGRSLMRSSDAKESSLAALEAVARDTIEKGGKYFAIVAPYRISNYKGSTINTLSDFQEQCVDGALKAIGSVVDAFGVNENACGLAYAQNPNQAFIDYTVMKEIPNDILVWDAQQLIDDLKSSDLSNENGWDNMPKEKVSFTNPGADIWFDTEYNHWISVQRTRQ